MDNTPETGGSALHDVAVAEATKAAMKAVDETAIVFAEQARGLTTAVNYESAADLASRLREMKSSLNDVMRQADKVKSSPAIVQTLNKSVQMYNETRAATTLALYEKFAKADFDQCIQLLDDAFNKASQTIPSVHTLTFQGCEGLAGSVYFCIRKLEDQIKQWSGSIPEAVVREYNLLVSKKQMEVHALIENWQERVRQVQIDRERQGEEWDMNGLTSSMGEVRFHPSSLQTNPGAPGLGLPPSNTPAETGAPQPQLHTPSRHSADESLGQDTEQQETHDDDERVRQGAPLADTNAPPGPGGLDPATRGTTMPVADQRGSRPEVAQPNPMMRPETRRPPPPPQITSTPFGVGPQGAWGGPAQPRAAYPPQMSRAQMPLYTGTQYPMDFSGYTPQLLNTSDSRVVYLMPHTPAPKPRLKMPPAPYPKFYGVDRDYRMWKKDWAAVQVLGDDSGGDDTVKKIHLLASLDDKVRRRVPGLQNLRTSAEIQDELEREYGNVGRLTNSIVEEIESFPRVSDDNTRKMLELIYMIERAVIDLQEMSRITAVDNPGIIYKIESKLPPTILREWDFYETNPSNRVTQATKFNHLLQFLKGRKEFLKKREKMEQGRAGARPKDENQGRGGGNKTPRRNFTGATRQAHEEEEPENFNPRGDSSGRQVHASTRQNDRETPNNNHREWASQATRSAPPRAEEADRGRTWPKCGACGEPDAHPLSKCPSFAKLHRAARMEVVKKANACVKCLFSHGSLKCTNNDYLCYCKCKKHYMLCPNWTPKKWGKSGAQATPSQAGGRPLESTVEQLNFLNRLQETNPNLVAEYKKAHTNIVVSTLCGGTESIITMSAGQVPNILLLLQNVLSNTGDQIGAMIDTGSDSNYVTHECARRLNLSGRDVILAVCGVGRMEQKVYTKLYTLRLRKRAPHGPPRVHELKCYGLDEIAEVHEVPTAESLKKIFPLVPIEELIRPQRVDLLLGMCDASVMPQITMMVGNMVLMEGPLGKVVGGSHPSILERINKTVHKSSVHYARSWRAAAFAYGETVRSETALTSSKEILEMFSWSSIGAPCEPKCGGCRCGNCALGGKEMSLAEEKQMDIIHENLTFVEADEHSDQPHWDTSYPYCTDPATLPNNRSGAMGTFMNMEKRLEKESKEWRETYKGQVKDMVDRGAAVKLTEKQIADWQGPVWYISNLAAPNPNSTTTPVRIVWNSSQQFKGVSLNDVLHKGPDVLNQIRAVILRFRSGRYAALGDIRKMYNSVWLKELEVHLHRFLWRYDPKDEVDTYAVVRVNMGDKPSGSIAQIAMRKTAELPQYNEMKTERRVVVEDSYVDDIMTSHNDKGELQKITKGVSDLLRGGNFHVKEWIMSGEPTPNKDGNLIATKTSPGVSVLLPNQRQEGVEKALGMFYHTEQDVLSIHTSINFSVKKMKRRIGTDLHAEEVRGNTPEKLTRRILLSQHAALYDPVGLVAPAKIKGAILVRKAFQEAGGGELTSVTWDEPLSAELREDSIKLFEEYASIGQVKFPRSLTPDGWKGKPWGITFSDGSQDAYGAVMYLRWETDTGVELRLVEAKAKLTPLDQRGDATKSELCGAVTASRLKVYFLKHCHIEVERWIHFVDSQTILGAIQRDSYTHQIYVANRVAEIQKAGSASDWKWVAGELNVADMVTRGAGPKELGSNSTWQRGPDFLRDPEELWPVKSAQAIAEEKKREVTAPYQTTNCAAITRSQDRSKASGDNTGAVVAKSTEALSKPGSAGRNRARSVPLATPVCGEMEEDGPPPPTADRAEPGSAGPTSQTDPVPLTPAEEEASRWGRLAAEMVDPRDYSSLNKLCGVVAWVTRAAMKWRAKAKRNLGQPCDQSQREGRPLHRPVLALSAKERDEAFKNLALATQKGYQFNETTLKRLVTFRDRNSDLLLCGGRIQSWTEDGEAVPLLPYHSCLGKLLARETHGENHEGVATTLLKTMKKAWIVQGRRVVKEAMNGCVECRKRRVRACQQVMGILPTERTTPAEPFEYTTLDLFGPYEVTDCVKKRTTMKAWGVVFCCMASRAIYADLVSDISTEGFLKAYARFAAIRGHPRRLWSDHGTNFVGAKPALKELNQYLNGLDHDEIQTVAAIKGTEWKWIMSPADSPHRNGAAEAAVKIIKTALGSLTGVSSKLTWDELQTVLFEAANLANERPINAHAQVEEDTVVYITPNSLLQGHTRRGGNFMGINFQDYPWKRLQAIQEAVDKFWTKWSALAGPSLFVRSKWHQRERDVAVGDLVWVVDTNALKGQYRLGKVESVTTGEDGVVRTANVKTCTGLRAMPSNDPRRGQPTLRTPYSTVNLQRDVRRLVVLLPVEEQINMLEEPATKDSVDDGESTSPLSLGD